MSKRGDPRLGDLFNGNVTSHIKVALLGYPCDIGVKRNGGRVGSKNGPKFVRQKLVKTGPLINPEYNIDLSNIHIVDKGDIAISDNLEENHATLTEAVSSLCSNGYIGIIIGGGNDQSFPNARGLMNSLQSGCLGVVNVDAHLDVRPLMDDTLAHSGSPFRQLLADNDFKKAGAFCEFAAQGNQCSKEHAEFVESHGGKIVWLSQVCKGGVKERFSNVLSEFGNKDVFVSFDIDSIQGSDCPGVSCPAVIGLSAQDALDICYLAGQHSKTRLLDLSEYNPMVEEDRTARLVSTMIYYFLMGLTQRKL